MEADRFVYINLGRPLGELLLPTGGEDVVYFRLSFGLKTAADGWLGRLTDNYVSNTQEEVCLLYHANESKTNH